MNQHFNKKSIEAAIRVAFANKESNIAVNGDRSKVRYKVGYEGMFDNICLMAETKENGYTVTHSLASVDVSELTKRQLAKNDAVELITNHFTQVINNFRAA